VGRMIEKHHITRMEVYLVVVVGLIPLLVSNSVFHHVIVLSGVYAISALGLSLFMGYAGQISIGHSAFFGTGAYITGILSVRFGVPPVLALPAGALAAGLAALIAGRPILRLREYFLALATIGLVIIFQVFATELRGFTGGAGGLSDIPWFSIAGFAFDSPLKQFYLVWAILYLLFLFARNLVRSKYGRAALAVAGNEDVSRSIGISPDAVKLRLFVLSAVYAGLGGGLFALVLTSLNPNSFDLRMSVNMVMMVILGGMGSLAGSVAGAVLLTWLMHLLSGYQEYSLPAFGLLLILFLVFLPEGIFRGAGSRWFDVVRTYADDNWRKELDR